MQKQYTLNDIKRLNGIFSLNSEIEELNSLGATNKNIYVASEQYEDRDFTPEHILRRTGDQDYEDMQDIFDAEFKSTDSWKDFIYTLLDYGYEDIPSYKMVEFVNENFDNADITTNNTGAIRAAWKRSL